MVGVVCDASCIAGALCDAFSMPCRGRRVHHSCATCITPSCVVGALAMPCIGREIPCLHQLHATTVTDPVQFTKMATKKTSQTLRLTRSVKIEGSCYPSL